MEKLKKREAFDRAVQAFGDWRGWSRWQHIAYGLIRGVSYPRMERSSNDWLDHYGITRALMQLGAWPEPVAEETPRSWWERLFSKKAVDRKAAFPSYESIKPRLAEVAALVVWVKKTPRVKKERVQRVELVSAAGE